MSDHTHTHTHTLSHKHTHTHTHNHLCRPLSVFNTFATHTHTHTHTYTLVYAHCRYAVNGIYQQCRACNAACDPTRRCSGPGADQCDACRTLLIPLLSLSLSLSFSLSFLLSHLTWHMVSPSPPHMSLSTPSYASPHTTHTHTHTHTHTPAPTHLQSRMYTFILMFTGASART